MVGKYGDGATEVCENAEKIPDFSTKMGQKRRL